MNDCGKAAQASISYIRSSKVKQSLSSRREPSSVIQATTEKETVPMSIVTAIMEAGASTFKDFSLCTQRKLVLSVKENTLQK